MSRKKSVARALSLWLFAALPSLSLGAPPNRLAASLSVSNQPGLEVRLQTHLTSYGLRPGSPFQCVVIRPFEVNGQVLIPLGSIVSGHVAKVKSVGMGFLRDRAMLELSFDEYTMPNGRVFPLNAKLTSIDNANERVTSKGQIRGVIAASNPNNFIFGVWNRPSVDQFSRSLIGLTGASNQLYAKFALGPISAVGLLALRCALFKFPEPEIHIPPGADMTLAVHVIPADLANVAGNSELPGNYRPSTVLTDWLQNAPYGIIKRSGEVAGDVINVALVGSREELEDAFQAAGWTPADANTYLNYSRMWSSFNAMQVYSSAPVSTLLYGGTLPALVFEKSLNSIAKRHHIRIWRAGVVDGQEIWLGAATHDNGIAFKFRSVSLTHTIDAHIDTERTKVATDLIFAGCSEAAAWVDRPNFTVNPESVISTDGAVEVLALQPCVSSTATVASALPGRPGNKATRLTRRIVLETRNYIWRENAYYLGYQLVRRKFASRSGSASEQGFFGN